MRYRIAICEDEPAVNERLKEKIEDCFRRKGAETEIHCFYRPEELLQSAAVSAYHICFLDIELKADVLNGIGLAAALLQESSGHRPVIIFISNRSEMVYESLKLQPLRFIRKGRFAEEISEAVDAALEKLREMPELLTIRQNGRLISLETFDILYIESLNRVQLVVTERETYQTYSTFRSFCSLLEPKGFLQIHRSYLVNWKAIRRIDARSVELRNGIALPVSKYKAAEVKRRYHQLLME